MSHWLRRALVLVLLALGLPSALAAVTPLRTIHDSFTTSTCLPSSVTLIQQHAPTVETTLRYDALGRLLTRTHLGAPNDQGERAFRARRAFVWDGDGLLAETGLNFEDAITWRTQYLPGPSGLDDAPLVRVEANLQGGGSSDPRVYAYLRDEMGSVIALARDNPDGGEPHLLARVLYTPYGEAHLETGPEPLRLWFDPTLTSAGGQTQVIAPPEPPATESGAIPGGLRLTTTAPLDPASVTAGLGVERYDPDSGSWEVVPASELAAGPSSSDDATLDLVLLAGWPKGGQVRITLRPALVDGFGRALQIPAGEDPSGVRVTVRIPPTDEPPALDRRWPLRFDSGYAAANSLGGAFPGGQTSLFQGLWTDPVTGLAYARARWYDTRTASWLSEDPVGTFDSPNLYAFVAWQPHMYRDPSGESLWTAYRDTKEAIGSVLAHPRVQGAMQVAQGAMEISIGAAGAKTGLGLMAVAHGSDTSAAGLVALITGEAQTTATHRAARDLALLAGANEGVAEQVGFWTDMAVGTAASIGAARARAARAPPGVRGAAGNAPKSGPGEWILKKESLGSGASYQAASVPGRAGQTYRVSFKNLNPRGRRHVDFDDFERELNALIDYKTSIRTTKKGLDQALRQVAAAREHGVRVIWRVPTRAQRLRAEAFLRRKGIPDIAVELKP